ncbi:PD-(D/E)XK motif protein [Pseudomonas sp. HR96]|uniref:PD-(D/E)XK motif protein n=1 Tax=Pseudomonas sp. HR96 TaxID=1027966 RepID=UPI002A75CC44|nr:PD-(D/E)XK motif protein [Pseudomonas sp. HR96]WPP01160.1 PD-(D/E)XK motif protein [Pseudomonas sp. HR96]
MTELLKEIQEGFANLDQSGRMLPLRAMPVDCAAWVFREGTAFGVAIECSAALELSEGFAGAKLRTVDRVISQQHRRFLRLESSIEWLRNEFGVICAHMVSVEAGASVRQALLADPLNWWERWRHLLGNAVVDRHGYDVLAELLALETLVTGGAIYEWSGPFGGVVDIKTSETDYEIKSTISRYGTVINISGHFQLAASSGKPLQLLYYRFEPAHDGLSIDLVCDRLIALGVDAVLLETALQRLGMEAGCSARKEGYNLLESLSYAIDENFPKITPASFKGGVLPRGIVQFEYKVDLSGLNSSPL